MSREVIDSIISLIEKVLGYSYGEPDFKVVVGVCVCAWVIAARVFMAIFSSKRGIVAAFLAFVLPVGLAFCAYALAELYVVPQVSYRGWEVFVIPSACFWLFGFLAVIVIAKRIWSLSAGVSCFIYVVASAAAIGAFFGVQVTIGVIEYGGEQVEQRDKRVNSEIDALL